MTVKKYRTTGRLTLRQPPSRETAKASALALELGTARAEDVIRILWGDPMSALNILKRANESYYGLREKIGSIWHAVEILGVEACLRLLSDSAESATESPVIDAVIRHATATASISHRLATGSWLWNDHSPSRPGLVSTAGLLHSIGRIALCISFPSETESLYGYSELSFPVEGDRQELEQLQFGIDYAEVGEFIGRKMHLPSELIESARGHVQPTMYPPESTARRISLIVGAAGFLADQSGYGMEPQVSFTYTGENSILSAFQSEVALQPSTLNDVLEELDQMKLNSPTQASIKIGRSKDRGAQPRQIKPRAGSAPKSTQHPDARAGAR